MMSFMSGSEERPLCECHGEPKAKTGFSGGKQRWRCSVKNREHVRVYREANLEKVRENMRLYRVRKKAAGLCPHCGVREMAPFISSCVRCQRYYAEYEFLGYSTIPLAKGSEG